MSEREEVLNEFGTAECVKRDDCTHFDCVAERKMADEIVRLRTALTTAERDRDAMAADAERYRWIRDEDTPTADVMTYVVDTGTLAMLSGDALDDAIDAHRARAKEGT